MVHAPGREHEVVVRAGGSMSHRSPFASVPAVVGSPQPQEPDESHETHEIAPALLGFLSLAGLYLLAVLLGGWVIRRQAFPGTRVVNRMLMTLLTLMAVSTEAKAVIITTTISGSARFRASKTSMPDMSGSMTSTIATSICRG